MNISDIWLVSLLLIIASSQIQSASLSVKEQQKYKRFLEGQGLYSSEDDVEVLTVNNFKTAITHSSQAWFVEFYNSWCGFCQRFAPSWKALGTDIKGWSDMIRVAAIDCSVDDNFPICREYEIMGYPTLKYFHENFEPGAQNLGIDVRKGDDVTSHRHFLLDTVMEEQRNLRGAMYPYLGLYKSPDTTQLLYGVDKSKIKYGFLVVTEPESYLGPELSLDFNRIRNVLVRYGYSNNTALVNALKIDKFPTIVAVDHDSKVVVLPENSEGRPELREAIRKFLREKHIDASDVSAQNPQIFTGKWLEADVPDMASLMQERAKQALKERIKKMGDVIFQMDMETVLRYSLKHEVASIKKITGEKLEALKKFFTVLKKYFPFGHAGQLFLNELSVTVANVDQALGADLEEIIKRAELEESQVFSSPQQWLGCKGSAQNFRGYPCGLWKLWHYLTVNAAEQNQYNRNANPKEILEAMHGYIKNFFGCAECSQHFQEMAARRQIFNVTSYDSSIVWLWMAHNEVNKRLSGDPTDDPEFPKYQFPSAARCPTCRKADETWNVSEVLKYLKHMYSSINIRYIGSDTRILHMGLEGDPTTNGSSNIFKALDMSMCFILYVCSFLLLVLLIRMFLKRGYKKKPYVHDLLGKV